VSEFSLVFTPTSVSFITVRALVVAATSTRKELFAAQTEVSRIFSRCSPFCPGPNAADSWSNLAWATAVVGNYTPGPDGSGFDRAPGRMAALKATDPLEETAAPPLVVLHIIARTGASMATAPAVETGGRGAGRPAFTNSADAVASAKIVTARARRGPGLPHLKNSSDGTATNPATVERRVPAPGAADPRTGVRGALTAEAINGARGAGSIMPESGREQSPAHVQPARQESHSKWEPPPVHSPTWQGCDGRRHAAPRPCWRAS